MEFLTVMGLAIIGWIVIKFAIKIGKKTAHRQDQKRIQKELDAMMKKQRSREKALAAKLGLPESSERMLAAKDHPRFRKERLTKGEIRWKFVTTLFDRVCDRSLDDAEGFLEAFSLETHPAETILELLWQYQNWFHCQAEVNFGADNVNIREIQKAEPYNMEEMAAFLLALLAKRTNTSSKRVVMDYKQYRPKLFEQQGGICNGCKVKFPERNFTVDHIVPLKEGGTDNLENLQLLCAACNSIKGGRTMEYLFARLAQHDMDAI